MARRAEGGSWGEWPEGPRGVPGGGGPQSRRALTPRGTLKRAQVRHPPEPREATVSELNTVFTNDTTVSVVVSKITLG